MTCDYDRDLDLSATASLVFAILECLMTFYCNIPWISSSNNERKERSSSVESTFRYEELALSLYNIPWQISDKYRAVEEMYPNVSHASLLNG